MSCPIVKIVTASQLDEKAALLLKVFLLQDNFLILFGVMFVLF